MNTKYLLPALFLITSWVYPAQFNTRVSLSGNASYAGEGDVGHDSDVDVLNADQQSLRLMIEDSAVNTQWTLHLNTRRLHINGLSVSTGHSSDLFRYYELSHNWQDERDDNGSTLTGYELDHVYLKHETGNFNFGFGRQPVDWGSGRFWQPMNVFGAFSPTDLDTEYKPGIDTAIVNWYPSAFSSLEAVYAFAPHDNDEIKNSGAFYYRRQAGQNSEMAVLAGSVIGNTVYGASFESDWKGAGWRIESVYYDLQQSKDNKLFWIAGIDYQFNDGTFVSTEWYNNGLGSSYESSLAGDQAGLFDSFDIKQHFSQKILGVSANRDITPLLNANYTLLISPLKNSSGHYVYSALHQLNFNYSVSDESEFVLSLQHTSGTGLDKQNNIRSEFGHVPDGLTLIYRHYF